MITTFSINGVSSSTVGIFLKDEPRLSEAIPVEDVYNIPGRNGDIRVGTGAYQNRTLSMSCFADADDMSDIYAFLFGNEGYQKLILSNDSTHFLLASVTSAPEFQPMLGKLANFSIEFSCKPQRFLVSGETPVQMTDGGIIQNQTVFNALPVASVTISGTGTLTIGNYIVTITDYTGTITIDSSIMQAYNGTTNLNAYISCEEFPVLVPGNNTVSWDGDITAVSIAPNWWTI